MRRLVSVLALLAVHSATAATYNVGPSKPYATPSDVPWESLAPGDSVRIFWRATPYLDKWVICRVGTEAQPIVVSGVPDASGALPIIDGRNAVTRSALNYWNEPRGVIKVGGANTPADTQPAWVVIENLEIRGARASNTFTGRSGVTAYSSNASAIFVEKGDHLTVRNCWMHDCGNGFFAASGTSELLVERCRIDGNGNVGSIYEHNNYTEAKGATFQFNRFGPLLLGAGGNNLKDRSAGCVIRYNWIEGGNRQLDLVESDYTELTSDPRYHDTFVYGNVLHETGDDGNSQIVHYGGDGGATAGYRKGTLHFYANTVVSRRTGNTTLIRLSTGDESADVRDNVLFVTATGNRLALLDQAGTLVATRNWIKSGWVASHSGPAAVTDLGQVAGADPGFVNQAAGDFHLVAGSPCVDQAVALDPPSAAPAFEYAPVASGVARIPDEPMDLGAFELAGPVSVSPGVLPGMPLSLAPNPFFSSVEARWISDGAPNGDLEVFDLAGRRVARVPANGAGVWRWTPAPGTRRGVYFLRAPGARPIAAYYR